MLVNLEFPEQVVSGLSANPTERSREVLEALLLRQYAKGKISGGWPGRALGLDFYEREKFLKDNNAPPNITSEELAHQVADLERYLAE